MQFISQIANIASMNGLDAFWQQALQSSVIVSIGGAFKSALSKIDGEKVRNFGSFCQSLSFAMALIWFAMLALPMFKDDKDVLAIIGLAGFAVWILGYLLGGKESRKPSATDMLVLIFFATNIVAACASHYFTAAVFGLLKIVVYICSYFYLTAILQNSPKRKLVLVSEVSISICGF